MGRDSTECVCSEVAATDRGSTAERSGTRPPAMDSTDNVDCAVRFQLGRVVYEDEQDGSSDCHPGTLNCIQKGVLIA